MKCFDKRGITRYHDDSGEKWDDLHTRPLAFSLQVTYATFVHIQLTNVSHTAKSNFKTVSLQDVHGNMKDYHASLTPGKETGNKCTYIYN